MYFDIQPSDQILTKAKKEWSSVSGVVPTSASLCRYQSPDVAALRVEPHYYFQRTFKLYAVSNSD